MGRIEVGQIFERKVMPMARWMRRLQWRPTSHARWAVGAAALAIVMVGCSATPPAPQANGTASPTTSNPPTTSKPPTTSNPPTASPAVGQSNSASVESPSTSSTTQSKPSTSVDFSLVMAGDVLPHGSVDEDADKEVAGAGTYDFAPLMQPIRPWIENADIALCSLETPIAPVGERITGYPVFAAPKELPASLKKVGWDGCATANNHAWDKGQAGIKRTLDTLEAAGLGHTGTGRTPQETTSTQFYKVTKDGVSITIAHLSATALINGYSDPAQLGDSIHALKVDDINRRAKQAREAGADIVVFTPHWGTEYRHTADAFQQKIAQQIAAGGNVDVILGGHTHVPEPIARLKGGVNGEGMWVAYSMGNFLSNQDQRCCDMSTSTGLMMRVTISANPSGGAKVSGVTWSGVTVDALGGHRAYSLQDLVDGKYRDTVTLSAATIQSRYNDVISRIGQEYYDPKPPTSGGAVVTVMQRK